MAGDAGCGWAAWFRAHYRYDRRPSGFDLARWQLEHGGLVQRTAARLEQDGYRVALEHQNTFRMQSRSAPIVLAGTPDIVATRGDETLVVDCKTGNPKHADIMQVQIYMAAMRPSVGSGRVIVGRVQYRGDAMDIPASAVDEPFLETLRQTIFAIGGDQAPVRRPSARECGWCDIGDANCSERVEGETLTLTLEHRLF
jgi:hypothetical protein